MSVSDSLILEIKLRHTIKNKEYDSYIFYFECIGNYRSL